MSIYDKVTYNIKVKVVSHEDDRQRIETLEKRCETLRQALAAETQNMANIMKESPEWNECVKKIQRLFDSYPGQDSGEVGDSTLRTEHDLLAGGKKCEERTRTKPLKRKRSDSSSDTEGNIRSLTTDEANDDDYKTCANCNVAMHKKYFRANNGHSIVFRKMCSSCRYKRDSNK